MKKTILTILLSVIFILGLTGCMNSQNIVGTWEKVDGDIYDQKYIVLYQGGTGDAYSDKEEFETTGYAPQPISWEIKDDVLNITYTLVNKTTGYKLNKKDNQIISVDGKKIYQKYSNE